MTVRRVLLFKKSSMTKFEHNVNKMTSEEILSFFSTKRVPLKQSVSATNIKLPNIATLNLRDTKSVTCNMEIVQKELEKIKIREDGDDSMQFSGDIQTKDLYNNDIILVNKEALTYQGRTYSINEIAFSWKKDCRMWLWKNTCDIMKNKSVGHHFRSKLVHK